ncbi:biliverdin-producing heme oxygenase [uncultured Jannaschia sp.]|uniref:biliverdin-producing heme oxygenase n=1 Tax=uncultured Jannaschia sp. TaxID=293347 RepID=UPI0026373EDF|nr:biliverdin-producing heme oxygenase [uncultured Jannaschia sp.]
MSLRDRLRHETRTAHADVDARFGAYDIVQPGRYEDFLTAHLDALTSLDARADHRSGEDVRRDIAEMRGRIRQDLRRLGRADPPVAPPSTAGGPLHPDALRYAVWGSQIGMSFLHRRWAALPRTPVRTSSRFLTTPFAPPLWKALCRRLAATPATGDMSDRVVADAGRIFDIYAHAARRSPSDLSHAG